MKIIHVCSSSMSFKFFLREHLINLANEGHKVIAVCGEEDLEERRYLADNNIEFIVIPLERKIKLGSDIKSLWKLIKLFLSIKPDMVHTHTPKASLLGTLAARFGRVKKVIFHCHGLAFIKYDKVISKVGFFIERLPILFAHSTLAVSPSLAAFLTKKKYSFGKKIQVLGAGSICGVNISHFSQLERKAINHTHMKKSLVIGFLGRINNDKGINDFIYVVESLVARGFNVKGHIAGYLEDRTLTFPACITTFGPVSRGGAPSFLSSCHLFLFPSSREGFGLAAAEASAMGIPVVAYDIIGIRDAVINYKTGFLVEPGSVGQLVEKCEILLSNSELSNKFGLEGRKHIQENFSAKKVAKDFLDFYESEKIGL